MRINIRHAVRDQSSVWLLATNPGKDSMYTRSSMVVAFAELPEVVYRLCRQEP